MPVSVEWQVKHVVCPVGVDLNVPFFSQKASPSFAGGVVAYSSAESPCGWSVLWQTEQLSSAAGRRHDALTKTSSKRLVRWLTMSTCLSCGKEMPKSETARLP